MFIYLFSYGIVTLAVIKVKVLELLSLSTYEYYYSNVK